ncbi:pyridoxal-5'-phosphate-dependent protein [Falsochrobactrum shanghaiense]|uniref:Pyridoxal-5'-phosphate-dependent protein n=1 Tax=Falsochrobactrum shanghaiense TaxID=2201899 RepID=A0A316JC98_9HYPH|nr:threonine/serine dehydratase [Falsochrobactrum shanghaiense]PWL18908.1 pyridoxal-5'-phosphate-dependent protein [Falsochrobactrum shanghaiense]
MMDFSAISEAYDRLQGRHVRTPLLEYGQINELLGGRVLFKAENLQRTGSFKFRGAYNKIAALDPQLRARGVVAFSSGNHAQGVAAAAGAFGIAATVIMPADAPQLKRENTRRLGAELVLYDRQSGDRKAMAEKISAETGAVLVPPYDDEMVIAGQGTIGLEVAQQLKEAGAHADLLLCPVGGGGLVAGISIALRELLDGVKIYAAEPAGFDDTCRSLEKGERVANAPGATTICDAIVTPEPGEVTFPINLANLSGGFAVDDLEVARAVRMLFEVTKLVVEPGGAVAFAALLAKKIPLEGRTAVVILSGGNVDLEAFQNNFGLDVTGA